MPTFIPVIDEEQPSPAPSTGRRAGDRIPSRARQSLVAIGAVAATAAVLAMASTIAGHWG